jgi:hypothetical protein
MAHYAKVKDGIVLKVLVAEADFINNMVETEPGIWVKTSYNMKGGKYYDPSTGQEAADQSVITGDEARERKNFAGIGYHYDGTGFYEPKPFDSWTFNSTTYLWEAPIAYPDDGNNYTWNESAYQVDNTQGWEQVT